MRLKGWLVSTLALGMTVGLAAAAGAAPKHEGTPPRSPEVLFDSGIAEMPMHEAAPAEKSVSVPNVGYALGEIEPEACTSGNATFIWTVQDGCGDGLYLRFFDETNGLVWPDTHHVYTVGSHKTQVYKLSVKRGAKICYGAQDPYDGGYWGVDTDNSQSCSSCCNVVPSQGNISRKINLTC